jgi:hypothetical protein
MMIPKAGEGIKKVAFMRHWRTCVSDGLPAFSEFRGRKK